MRDFHAFVPMTCPGVTPGRFTTQIGTAILNKIKIAPDGSFIGASTSGGDTSVRVRGKLKGRRITGGRAELSVGACVGSAAYSASR